MRRKRSKTVIIILALAALVYVGNILIDNPYTHSVVNYYLNNQILNKLPIRADYQSMKLQMFPPAITIYGIKVESQTKDSKSEELVSMSTLTFKVSLWSVFMGSQQLGDLELKDVKLNWPPPPEFITALKALQPNNPSSNGPPVWPPTMAPPLSSLKISNAVVVAQLDGISFNSNQDPKELTRVIAEGFNLDAEIRDWKSFKIEVNSAKTSISDRSSSYMENGQINVRAEMRGKNFVARKIEVTSPRLNFFGKSNIEIKTKKNTTIIDSISTTITGDNIAGDMSILGSFLDIPGNRGEFKATTKTLFNIPVTSKQQSTFVTTGTIKSNDARFSDFRLYETESEFEIDLNKFKLINTALKIGETTVAKGGGQINFSKGLDYEFNLKPTGLPFRNLMDIFNVDIDAVNFELTSHNLKITGTSSPFNMTVSSDVQLSNFDTPSAQYNHSHYPISPQCDMSLNFEVNSSSLFFRNTAGSCYTPESSGQIGKFPLAISGFATFASDTGMDIAIHSPQFNLQPISYFAQAKLGGRGTFESRIFGPYSGVKIATTLDIKEASIGSNQLAAIKGSTEVGGGKLTWKNITLITDSGGSIDSSNGTLEFNEDMDLDFDLDGKMIAPSTVGTLVRDLTDGKTQLELTLNAISAHLKGPAKKPLKWNGQLTINAENVRSGEATLARSIKGTIKGTESGYITEDLEIYSAGTKAEIRFNHVRDTSSTKSDFMGGTGLQRSDQLEISANLRAVPGRGGDLQQLPIIGKDLTNLGMSSEISGNLKLAGSFQRLTGLAKLQLAKTKILNSPVSDIIGSIVIDGTKLDIMAEQGGSALKARVSLDLGAPDVPFNWYIAAKNADFRPWLPALMSQDARNFAYLSATWTMEGTFKHFFDSVGELELKDLRVRYYSMVSRSGQRVDFRSAHPAKLFFEKTGWRLSDSRPIVINSSIGEFSFGLRNHHPPAHLGLTTKGYLDVEALRLVIPDVEISSGSLIIDGGIFGTVDNPNVDIFVRDGLDRDSKAPMAIGLNGFRPSFQNIKLDARVRTNGIYIKTLRANKGNGLINASGFLARPDSGEETDITVNMDDTSFLYPFPIIKYFDSTIGGQIKITGSGRPWTASGRIDIVKARSNRDVDLREAIMESIRSQSASDSTNTIVPLINMDISITADKSIGFSSKAGQATLSSDLRVSGSNITPSIIGMVDISKGRFFYKREFEIKRGLINFDDPIKVDPSLDISAISDVSSYRVGINITGRASTPIIDFTVEPPTRPDGTPLSKIDIIGLLNRGSLPESSSGIGTAESTAASEALNIAAGQVEDTVQKIFDLSGQNVIRQVYIDTYADSEGMPVVRFNLPLNITEDFDVVLKVDQSTVKVSSEYSLHDSISLTGGIESNNDQTGINSKTTGAPADTGVDLKFKFAFP